MKNIKELENAIKRQGEKLSNKGFDKQDLENIIFGEEDLLEIHAESLEIIDGDENWQHIRDVQHDVIEETF